MIKAVVFDIGGVLLTDPKYKEFWPKTPKAQELKELFGRGKITVSEFGKKGARIFKLSEPEFLENHRKAYHSIKKVKSVIEIFKSIKLDKYILSDSNPVHMPYIKKNFADILGLVKESYFSPETGTKKTDRETFEFLIKKIGTKPQEIVFVDNLDSCLVEARKCRINTILFKNPEQLKKDLKKLGVE